MRRFFIYAIIAVNIITSALNWYAVIMHNNDVLGISIIVIVHTLLVILLILLKDLNVYIQRVGNIENSTVDGVNNYNKNKKDNYNDFKTLIMNLKH